MPRRLVHGYGPRDGEQLEQLARAAERLREAIFDHGEATTAAVRRAAYDGTPAVPLLADFVGRVRANAKRMPRCCLADNGPSDDSIFEVIVAAALGAAQRRLEHGLALLELAPRR